MLKSDKTHIFFPLIEHTVYLKKTASYQNSRKVQYKL